MARSPEGPSGPDRRAADAQRGAEEAIDKYAEGFEQDLEPLLFGSERLEPAEAAPRTGSALPAVWNEPFETEDDGQRELKVANARFQRLSGAVELSIAARAHP